MKSCENCIKKECKIYSKYNGEILPVTLARTCNEYREEKKEKLINYYISAKQFVIDNGFQKEIDIVDNRTFGEQDKIDFFCEFVYVVLNAGMKNQVAEIIFARYAKNGLSAIKHEGKRRAIEKAEKLYDKWFATLQKKTSLKRKLDYLETLPWIGPITKYHLARNLGLDVAKPDRHLVRIAEHFNYKDVQQMCEDISEWKGDRIGVVDVALWRYANLNRNYLEEKVE